MYTTETAPADYYGPVRLTPEQKANGQRATDAYTRTLIAAARDDSDPEYRDNARTILDFRGIAY